jgi:hypothetical protein
MKYLCLFLMLFSFASADYLGSWAIDDVITVMTTTHRFSTGAAYAATGNVDLWVYEDVTAAQIQTLTMSAFDSITGLYEEQVTLSTANGFEAGKHYTVLIQATVDSVSAITTHNFQIEAEVNVQGGTIDTCTTNTDLVTAAVIADAVWDETSTGHTTTGKAGRQLWTTMDNIIIDTAEIGLNGVGLSNIPWDSDWDAEVQSEVTDALNLYDPPTNTEMGLRTLPFEDYVIVSDTISGCTTVGSVTGSVGSVVGSVGSVSGDTKQTADVADLITTVGVNGSGLSGVADIVWNEAGVEPVGVPAHTDQFREMLAQIWAYHFNETVTTIDETRFKDSTGTVLSEANIQDVTNVFTKGKHATPDP